MSHDVFISHSTDDKLVALALCNKLETAGVRCWIAPRDVGPGAEWGKAIVDAIRDCRIMVLVFSSKANDSRHIHREVQTAFEKDLTVIPFRVENTQPTGTMEYYLGSVHWLDALTAPVESHLLQVVDRVKALLPAAKPEPLAQTTPPVATRPEILPAESGHTNPPEGTRPPLIDVQPPIIPGAVPLPIPAQSPPVPAIERKKITKQVLLGVAGIVAIGLGAWQIANGLHLFSSKHTSPSRQDPVISNEMTQLADSLRSTPIPSTPDTVRMQLVQGFYLFIPKDWEKKESSPTSTMFIAPKSSGLSANVIITSDPFAGTLRQYVDATISAVKASSPAVRQVSDATFSAILTNPGYRVGFRNKIKDLEFSQVIYFFDADPGTKLAITTSAPNAQAPQLEPLFDDSVGKLVARSQK
ncbi:MAG: hypothetical protein QOH01_857 [Verrucomicrobiota bacterium]|jgi:hypothetical protein